MSENAVVSINEFIKPGLLLVFVFFSTNLRDTTQEGGSIMAKEYQVVHVEFVP